MASTPLMMRPLSCGEMSCGAAEATSTIDPHVFPGRGNWINGVGGAASVASFPPGRFGLDGANGYAVRVSPVGISGAVRSGTRQMDPPPGRAAVDDARRRMVVGDANRSGAVGISGIPVGASGPATLALDRRPSAGNDDLAAARCACGDAGAPANRSPRMGPLSPAAARSEMGLGDNGRAFGKQLPAGPDPTPSPTMRSGITFRPPACF